MLKNHQFLTNLIVLKFVILIHLCHKKNVIEGGSQIRDILNDLSSRLELLSMEKKAATKTKFPAYASAESSFSRILEPSDSSSLESINKNVAGGVQNVVELYEDEVDFFEKSHKNSETSNVGMMEKEPERVDQELVSVRQSYESIVEDEEEKSELQGSYGDGTFVTRVDKSKKNFQRLKKREPKNTYERLRSMGRSFASKYGEEDEDDNDCVVLSSKQSFQKAVGRGANLKKYDHFEEVDGLEDYGDDSLSEGDQPIILSGRKSTYKLPSKIVKMLYPHQREGLKWL